MKLRFVESCCVVFVELMFVLFSKIEKCSRR